MPNRNALSNLNASRQAEGRRRMTHWAPPALIPRPSLADVAEFAAEAVTPYGNYVSARDAVEDFQGGHPVMGSMNALLALPGLGIVGAVGRGAKRAGQTVNALSEGARFALSADQKRRKLSLVEMPVSAIESSIKQNKTFYVGPNGTGAGIEGRYQTLAEKAKAGTPLDAPTLHVDKAGAMSFSDGRHRFAVARDLGADTVKVAMERGAITNARRAGIIP